MTPPEISICLHYYCSPEDMRWCVELDGAPCRDATMLGLIERGLIVDTLLDTRPDDPGRGSRFKRTEKLDAFVELLCKTPLPEKKWIDPRDNSVIREMRSA